MNQFLSPSGLSTVPQLEWGSHLAQVFAVDRELRDTLVPYFKAGLEDGQRCLWVAGREFNADEARQALSAAIPDLAKRERDQQIQIFNAGDWYSSEDKLRPQDLVDGLLRLEQEALSAGYSGLRTSGNCAWVSTNQWDDFLEYERLVQSTVKGRRMICLCSFCTDQLHDGSHFEIMQRHDLVLPSAVPVARSTHAIVQARKAADRHQRTFDLAMTAANMGTWRYTLADNICIYDANAQRLYGLTEPRFLHDEEGVNSKFHPDDQALMWDRVASALDPLGDGRYDVEYRVKQLDGTWR